MIKCPNPEYNLHRCDYGLLVPATRPGRQEVVEYKYSVKPDYVTKTDGNEYFVKWKIRSFAETNKTPLEVTMKIKIKLYDLKTAKKQPVKNAEDMDTLLYLKSEENFQIKAKNIKEASNSLTGVDREEMVKNIFNYVINNLDYKIFFYQDRGAKKALKEGKGDCTEYSELMITLCRAKKIPARIVMGLIPSITGEIGYHNWVEVYFPLYGWVAFDPTWADHPYSTTTFESMKNTYVQLSNKRFIDPVLCPCYFGGEIPFSLKLKDTCVDISNGINKRVGLMLMYYNSFQSAKADSLLDSLLVHEPDNYRFLMFSGVTKARLGEFDKGLINMQNAVKNATSNLEKKYCLYAFANYYALKGDGENAVKYIKEAIDAGFDNYEHINADKDLVKIKEYPPFIELKNEMKVKENKK